MKTLELCSLGFLFLIFGCNTVAGKEVPAPAAVPPVSAPLLPEDPLVDASATEPPPRKPGSGSGGGGGGTPGGGGFPGLNPGGLTPGGGGGGGGTGDSTSDCRPPAPGQPGYPGKPVGCQLTGKPCKVAANAAFVPILLDGVCSPGKVDGYVCCQSLSVGGLVTIVENCKQPEYCCVAKVALGVLVNFATVTC